MLIRIELIYGQMLQVILLIHGCALQIMGVRLPSFSDQRSRNSAILDLDEEFVRCISIVLPSMIVVKTPVRRLS